MRTEKLDRRPRPKETPAKVNPMIHLVEEFAKSGDMYHQVICDESQYEKLESRLRVAVGKLGVGERIKVHNTYRYDDEGNKDGRILWLENLEA